MPGTCRLLLQGTVGMACLLLSACDRPEPAGTSRTSAATAQGESSTFQQAILADPIVSELTSAYLDQILIDYRQAQDSAEALRQSVVGLLDNPSDSTLAQARQSWLTAHDDYAATTLHGYFLQALPARNTSGVSMDLAMERLHYQMDYWPILAGYVDYLADYPDSGLVGDMTVPLSREAIIQQHGVFDLSEVLLGFHPLEFLLWGEPVSAAPGQRPWSDYLEETQLTSEQAADGLQLTQLTNNRRRQLLNLVSDLLVKDIEAARQLWSSNRSGLRDLLASLSGPRQLGLLLQSMSAVITEEIMVKSLSPLLNGDYENSLHSVYSHSSARAARAQLQRIESLLSTAAATTVTLEVMLAELMPDFSQVFYQNLDAGQQCLEQLYLTVAQNSDPDVAMTIESEIVECINYMGNLTNTLRLAAAGMP